MIFWNEDAGGMVSSIWEDLLGILISKSTTEIEEAAVDFVGEIRPLFEWKYFMLALSRAFRQISIQP